MPQEVLNFINGQYVQASGKQKIDVTDPATEEIIAKITCSSVGDVDTAVQHAKTAQRKWAAETVKTRVQPLFKLKQLMEDNMDTIVELVRKENGKNVAEGKASTMKGIETIEWATSLPQMAAGKFLEVSRGITCRDVRDPVGVVTCIVPFNFPIMVPMWTVPIALGCGNAVILKPSEKVPLTMNYVAGLIKQAGIPDGVFQIVNGGRETVEALTDHPEIKALTFVGSSAIAKLVSQRAIKSGKRALCLGGAKNHLCVLPDANYDMCTTDIMNSFAGSTGQRCMAASVLVVVGDVKQLFFDLLISKAKALTAGQQPGQIGPVIDETSKTRILRYINEAETRDGAEVLVDGRNWSSKKGFWVGPTILLHKSAKDAAVVDEIFGPILSVVNVNTFDEALEIENRNPYGNAASIYTSVGKNSEYFLSRFSSAMLGVNVGVPVPREPFSFGGMNGSNFGVGDITGDNCMEFFTQRKKITQKWVPPQDKNVITSSFIS